MIEFWESTKMGLDALMLKKKHEKKLRPLETLF